MNLLSPLLRHLQSLDHEALIPLKAHEGKILRIYAKDLNFEIYFQVQEGFLQKTTSNDTPNTQLCGPAFKLMKLLTHTVPGPHAFYGQGVQVLGDTTFLQALKQGMQGYDPDLEGLLAQGIGDVGAATVSRFFQATRDTFKQWTHDRVTDTVEYFQYEKPMLASREAFQNFIQRLDEFEATLQTIDET